MSNNAMMLTQVQDLAEGVHNGPVGGLWVDGKLLLARRVLIGGRKEIVGCWLNWQAVQPWLLANVRDLLPGAQLTPAPQMKHADPSRLLAALPVRLVPGEVPLVTPSRSAISLVLTTAWAGVLLAAVTAGFLLHRTLLLARRRAAFVSAVTHELRTPLTTFNMYTEMLVDGTVIDAERQAQYHRTLHVESQRLGRLVENVLTYSRLEKGTGGVACHRVDLSQLLAAMESRLRGRADAAGMQLQVQLPEQPVDAFASPDAVEHILANLVDNACKYANRTEDKRIDIAVEEDANRPTIRVSDHGPGIPPADRRAVFRTFARGSTTSDAASGGVGLGLAISRQLARAMRGELLLDGTRDGASFRLVLLRASS
jgi:signal transduction histidine kinase